MMDDKGDEEGGEREDEQLPYEVGYGCPPVEHRWVKGSPSPNPRGRPRGSQSRHSITRRVAEEKRAYSEGGRKKTSENLKLVIMTVRNHAAKGDLLAIALYDWLDGQQMTSEPFIQKGVLIVDERLSQEEWETKYGDVAEG